ncbi:MULTISPECIES: universal stress protein [Niastella]|uniref:Universal stress protein n=1 Tax=Niastella soli TaxID=2821487 RepID=A0ABS3YRW0_9BACT|nr:universal stress protein [Niastella soli]MBO9200654.1 universal stress protein [Niastella soli]
MTNILIPTDYSEASFNALETAIIIAKRNNASLILLNIDDAGYLPEDTYTIKNANQIGHAIADNIKQRHGIPTTVIFKEGFIGPTIVRLAFDIKPDLIVMGAYGASGHRDLFIGSNSYFTIKNASCPVLIVPEGKRWHDFNKVLFPIRPTFGAFKKYQFISDLVTKIHPGSNFELFGISIDSKEQDLKQVTEIANELKKGWKQSVQYEVSYSNGKHIGEEVLDKADKSKADLIVISSTVDVATKQSFIGPFSQRIINHARIPVLCVFRTPDN